MALKVLARVIVDPAKPPVAEHLPVTRRLPRTADHWVRGGRVRVR